VENTGVDALKDEIINFLHIIMYVVCVLLIVVKVFGRLSEYAFCVTNLAVRLGNKQTLLRPIYSELRVFSKFF